MSGEATKADRLAEIKSYMATVGAEYDVHAEDVFWLIAEVERLRAAFADISDPHHERTSGVGKGNCVECRYPWPCPTEQVAALARRAAVVETPEAALIEQTLQHHLPVVFDDYQVLCLCSETFEGPVYQRRHVASLIAAGLMCEPGCTHPAHSPEVALLRAVVETETGEEPK